MRLWFLSCSYFSVLWRCVLVTYAVKDFCSIPRRITAVSPDGPKMPKHAFPKEACVWVEHILHTRSFHRVCKLCKDIRKYYMIESRTIWSNIVKYDTAWYNITEYDMWHHMTWNDTPWNEPICHVSMSMPLYNYTIFYYIILYYTVLYYIILCYIILYYSIELILFTHKLYMRHIFT